MGLYEPKSCCICFDTKNGTLILASLDLIGAILSCLSVVFYLLYFSLHESLEPFVQYHDLDPEVKNNIGHYINTESGLHPDSWLTTKMEINYMNAGSEGIQQGSYQNIRSFAKVVYVCIAVLVYFTFTGVFSSLLIHGIRKDRPGLMMPYLVFQRIRIIMDIITISILTVLALCMLNPMVFLYNTLLIMAATIDIYFHLVINAYHKQVKRPVCGGKVYYKEIHNEGNDYKGEV